LFDLLSVDVLGVDLSSIYEIRYIGGRYIRGRFIVGRCIAVDRIKKFLVIGWKALPNFTKILSVQLKKSKLPLAQVQLPILSQEISLDLITGILR
jgi:hypothetical protein